MSAGLWRTARAILWRYPWPRMSTGVAMRVAMVLAWPLAALTAQPVRAQASATQRPATIVVLDGSNSMNARLPNDRNLKFVTVRDALRASLAGNSGADIGLAAFGARRASDCNDAEVIVPPSADPGPVLGALERFQPRGFSPVALSLRVAAKALPRDAVKASIVLVLDDLASCRSEDPCALAGALKRDLPSLAIHVVVLGPRGVDLPVLACMVKQTGGQLFQVTDGPGVAPAIQEALTVAGLDRRDAPKPDSTAERAAVQPPIATPRPPPPKGGLDPSRPGLHLTARLAEGAAALDIPIEWRIWAMQQPRTTDTGGAIPRREGAPLIEFRAPAVSRLLPNGRYEVEAKVGLIAVRRAIEIATQGPTPVALDLNAGMLAIAAPLAKGGQPAADANVTVLALGPPATPLWTGRGGSQSLVVPPGSYRVRIAAGLVNVERALTVGQGATGDVALPLEAGRLVVEEKVDASPANARPPELLVETDDPETPGGRRELYRANAPRLDLTLPVGAYVVSARRDSAELRERLQIKPGETVSRQFTMPMARVKLVGRLGTIAPAGMAVRYRIERLDAATRVLERWGTAELALLLSPGRYRINARLGDQNAVAVREVEVRAAAEEQRIDLDAGAGGVQLKVAGAAASLGFGDVYWQIFDDRGEAVWRTGQSEPLLALSAGRYRARAELRERVVEGAFDVRVGDNRVIELGG